jgi:phosphoribosylformylglycinamidine cyclo-ligase
MVNVANWPLPRLFALLGEGGDINPAEMARTFNCGIGMVAIVAPGEADAVQNGLEEAGETVYRIGEVIAGPRGCTVTGAADWGADEDWTVTHHA